MTSLYHHHTQVQDAYLWDKKLPSWVAIFTNKSRLLAISSEATKGKAILLSKKETAVNNVRQGAVLVVMRNEVHKLEQAGVVGIEEVHLWPLARFL